MRTGAAVAIAVIGRLVQASEASRPLPADPPIGGWVWSVLVPAALLVGASAATWLLYRRFSRDG